MTMIFVCRSESGLGFEHDHMVWLGEQEEAEMYYRCDDD